MSRHHLRVFSLIFVLMGLLAACDSEPPPTVTPPPAAAMATAVPDPIATPASSEEPGLQTEGVFFSELLPGVPGGNSQEFIELYNAGSEPVDLMGWSVF